MGLQALRIIYICSCTSLKGEIMRNRKEYFKAYRQAHRDELLAYGKAWYQANKEEAKVAKKDYYQAHREEAKAKMKAWYQANKEEAKVAKKDYYQAHKEEKKAKMKAYRQAHKEEAKAYRQAHKEEKKAWIKANKEQIKAYVHSDVNSLGQTKHSIRKKSWRILKKMNLHIPDYQIHHCFTYDDASKFIYISKALHRKIHQFLRDNNIDADIDHWMAIRDIVNSTDEFMYIKC